ncbi:MAG: type II secretion system protein, partial [Candidatus Levybacteria bacterium]|nr:type II secretion system protein [Candidatus Levybacteria bacterium]
MKKVSNQKNKGFTLIELLVVIGILGILVATLVATINPFEQIKKASDSNTKNVAVEYLNANIRYYTNHTEFPFDA